MKGVCLNIEIGDAISRVRFAPRSNNLLISSWDSTLRLYDVENSILRSEFSLETALLGCCFQDEATAFSIGSDFCLRRHDFDSGICYKLGNHDDTATCVEYSEETCQAITAGLDKQIISWDTRMKSSSTYSKLVSGDVESISLCGIYLIVAIGKSVNIYDLRNFEGPIQTIESCMDYRIRCVRSFSNLKGYAVGSVDGRVAVKYLNPSNANESYSFRCHPKSKDGKHHLVAVNDIVFLPSQNGAFVTGDDEGYASSWDAQSKKRRYQLGNDASLKQRATSNWLNLGYNEYNAKPGMALESIPFWGKQWFKHGVYSGLSSRDYMTVALDIFDVVAPRIDSSIATALGISKQQKSSPPKLDTVALRNDLEGAFNRPRINCEPRSTFDNIYFKFPRYSSSVASLSYNCGGQLLAVGSSYTYQEANETEEPPQIFIHEMDENQMRTPSCRSSN